jgi:hypothetical protein
MIAIITLCEGCPYGTIGININGALFATIGLFAAKTGTKINLHDRNNNIIRRMPLQSTFFPYPTIGKSMAGGKKAQIKFLLCSASRRADVIRLFEAFARRKTEPAGVFTHLQSMPAQEKGQNKYCKILTWLLTS